VLCLLIVGVPCAVSAPALSFASRIDVRIVVFLLGLKMG